MRRLAVVALLCVACAAPVVMTEQERATEIVWGEVYHAMCAPPVVQWVVECQGKLGQPGVLIDGVCHGGVTYCLPYESGEVRLPWVGSYSASAFAHEHLHAWQCCRGWRDPGHISDEWMTLEPLAREALRMVGL